MDEINVVESSFMRIRSCPHIPYSYRAGIILPEGWICWRCVAVLDAVIQFLRWGARCPFCPGQLGGKHNDLCAQGYREREP